MPWNAVDFDPRPSQDFFPCSRIPAPALVLAVRLVFWAAGLHAGDTPPPQPYGSRLRRQCPAKARPWWKWRALIALLPEAPAGWGADKPEGSTSESDGFPITTVSRTYFKGDADNAPTASINIIDSANNQQFQDATKAMWGATSDTAAGYDKAVKVAGLPGFEHFANADQTGRALGGGGRAVFRAGGDDRRSRRQSWRTG